MVNEKHYILLLSVSGNEQAFFSEATNTSLINSRVCFSPVRENKTSFHFEDNYISLRSKDCATSDAVDVKTVLSLAY